MYWNYWNSKDNPDADWNSTGDLSKWKHGASPLGWGDRDAGTPFDAGLLRPSDHELLRP